MYQFFVVVLLYDWAIFHIDGVIVGDLRVVGSIRGFFVFVGVFNGLFGRIRIGGL